MDEPIYPGDLQAPVWSSSGVSLIQTTHEPSNDIMYNDLDIYLTTRTTNGRSTSVYLGIIPWIDYEKYLRDVTRAGATEDATGRIYASCRGLYAVSPVTFNPLFPSSEFVIYYR